jgi:replicative DNA helicase
LKKSDVKIPEGFVPPHNKELERYVLGAIMKSREAMIQIIDSLNLDVFYYEEHRIIFTHIINLFKLGVNPDLMNVSIECKKFSPEITNKFISEIYSEAMDLSDIEHKVRYLAELSIRRIMITQSSAVSRFSYDQGLDIFEIISDHEKAISESIEFHTKNSLSSSRQLIHEALNEMEKNMHRELGLTGVPTGFKQLDKITSGWQKSDLIIVAARPGMGKTAFVLSMARNMAIDFKIPTAIFSLEMSSVQLIKRLISVQTEVNSSSIRSGQLSDGEFQQIHEKIQPLSDAPIFIDDSASLTLLDLKSKAMRLKKEHGIKVIIIDYLQLMSSGNTNSGYREMEISAISRGLKVLAKELEIPVIALSQLSRSVESRGDKRPMLSDLRESGAIEQDADLVTFLYRPEYYGILFDENNESLIGTCEVIVAKHRNGSLDSAKLKYIAQYTKFDNLQADEYVQSSTNNFRPNESFDNNPSDEIPF